MIEVIGLAILGIIGAFFAGSQRGYSSARKDAIYEANRAYKAGTKDVQDATQDVDTAPDDVLAERLRSIAAKRGEAGGDV